MSELERKINKEYQTAYEEVSEKYDKYISAFAEKDKVKLKQLEDGLITEKEYAQWRTGQVLIGERWQEMRDTLAEDLTKTDAKVLSMVNGYMPEAYALNHNYATFEVEKGSKVNTSYTLYSRETVENLIKEDPDLLPRRRLDIPKDKIWNKQHINSAITQGVLQGDDLKTISNRLRQVTDMDKKAAMRNARTMMTGAQNAGRLDAYNRAEKMGIKVLKQWMATLDHHTRSSHAHLDGQKVEIDKKFSNGLMFPGDSNGEPSEVYNCRCTMVADVPEYPDTNLTRYDNIAGKPIDKITYKDWIGWKQAGYNEKRVYSFDEVLGNAYNTKYTQEDRDAILKMYNEAPEEVKEFYAKYSDELRPNLEDNKGTIPRTKTDFGYYSPSEDRTHFMYKRDLEGRKDQLPFELGVHEYGHNMDYIAGRRNGVRTISNAYKNKDGLSFGEIINNDWKKAVREYAGYNNNDVLDIFDWQIEGQDGEGGMGTFGFARHILNEWRKVENISRDDSTYRSLLDELDSFSGSNSLAKEFLSKHKSLFFEIVAGDDITKEFYDEYVQKQTGVTPEDIKNFCRMMKSEYTFQERGCLSDMFENFSVTNGGPAYPFGLGHGKEYAQNYSSPSDPDYYDRLERESFAEFTEMCVVNKDALEVTKKYLPNAYDAYLDMIREAVK